MKAYFKCDFNANFGNSCLEAQTACITHTNTYLKFILHLKALDEMCRE